MYGCPPANSEKTVAPQRLQQAVVPQTQKDFLGLLNDLGEQDIILNAVTLDSESAWIYRALGERKIPYVVISLGAIPSRVRHGWRVVGSVREWLKLELEELAIRLTGIRNFIRILLDPAVNYATLPAPKLWLQGGALQRLASVYFPKPWRARRIKTHSFDCEAALFSRTKEIPTGNYAVFVDAALVGHPDFVHASAEDAVTPQKYFDGMKKLFGILERQLDMPVIVAGHPRVVYEHSPFDRPTYYGMTCELVGGSQLVITHCSTALAYAAIFRKRVMFATTNELEKGEFRLLIARASSWFGVKPVNADEVSETSRIEVAAVDERRWSTYELDFVREPAAPPRSIWSSLEMALDDSNGA
jgi:hypothetical protein